MSGDSELTKFFELNEALIAEGLMSEDTLEGRRFEELETPTSWEQYAEVRVTPELNELYAYSLDDGHPWYSGPSPFGAPLAHPIALVQLGTRPVLRQFPVTVPEGQSSLHAKMDCEFLRPAFVGALYREEGRLAEKYVRRGRRYLVTEGRFLDEDGQEVLRYRHTRMVGADEGEGR
jgi:acyl dehydratase